jgi:6-phosphogluconolactonase
MDVRGDLLILADTEDFARAAAERFAGFAAEAVEFRGRFDVALTGGSSPGPVFRLLASPGYLPRVPWEHVHLYWGDERCVPPGHPRSNYGAAARTLLAGAPVPPENVHRIRGELGAERAAEEYAAELEAAFGGPPRFDLMHLGLGEDGHILSLFPFDYPTLTERERWVLPTLNRALGEPRVTLTPPALDACRRIDLLVPGAAKAAIAHTAILGPADPFRVPAHLARAAAAEIAWLLTRESGREFLAATP